MESWEIECRNKELESIVSEETFVTWWGPCLSQNLFSAEDTANSLLNFLFIFRGEKKERLKLRFGSMMNGLSSFLSDPLILVPNQI